MKLDKFVDNTYIINGKQCVGRLKNSVDELKKIDIFQYEIVEAIYPLLIDNPYIPPSFKGNSGQLGCILSHIKVWEQIKNDKSNISLILEDDFSVNLSQYVLHIDNILEDLPSNFDIFYLHNFKNEEKNIYTYESGLLMKEKCPKTTHAYVLNSNFNILNWFSNLEDVLTNCKCRHHIDIMLKEYVNFNSIFACKQRIFWQNRKKFKSHILKSKRI